MEDIDIWRTAKAMINQYGEDALIMAAQRIDELMASGDIDGRIVWRRVYFAIEELLRTEGSPQRTVH